MAEVAPNILEMMASSFSCADILKDFFIYLFNVCWCFVCLSVYTPEEIGFHATIVRVMVEAELSTAGRAISALNF